MQCAGDENYHHHQFVTRASDEKYYHHWFVTRTSDDNHIFTAYSKRLIHKLHNVLLCFCFFLESGAHKGQPQKNIVESDRMCDI